MCYNINCSDNTYFFLYTFSKHLLPVSPFFLSIRVNAMIQKYIIIGTVSAITKPKERVDQLSCHLVVLLLFPFNVRNIIGQ